ncbi:MAG: hypothetical protein HKP41_00405 [Desulfobacterales bacterium]|nr:hypothetical protein [Desulfobacterales bacterium]
MNYLEQAEKAMKYLQESEEEAAQYKALLKFQPERHKALLARLQNDSLETTEAGRKRDAEASDAFSELLDESTEIAEHNYLLEAKRKRAEYKIELFRSTHSMQKRGNI